MVSEGAYRKNGDKTIALRMGIPSHHQNLVRLFGSIGYRYSKEKAARARYATQYLTMTGQNNDIIRKAFSVCQILRKEGKSIRNIAAILKEKGFPVTQGAVNYWVSHGVKNTQKLGTTKKSTTTFTRFIEQNANGLQDGLMWETIQSIEPTHAPKLLDLTTQSENHNFCQWF